MKKIIMFILATLFLIMFTSCGKNESTTATNNFSLQGSGS
jgi:uncharacterized lipoprotein YehR (DUF1307 family)